MPIFLIRYPFLENMSEMRPITVTDVLRVIPEGKHKLTHYSFRLDEEVIDELKQEAQKRLIPLSALVNRIVTEYVRRERYFEGLGFIPVSRDILRKIFSGRDEKYIIESGKEIGLTIAEEYVSYFFGDVNQFTLVRFLELWFGKFGSFQHKICNSRHYFSIKHDISTEYSRFLGQLVKSLAERITNSRTVISTLTQNTVAFFIDF
jgi:hypothetical protein